MHTFDMTTCWGPSDEGFDDAFLEQYAFVKPSHREEDLAMREEDRLADVDVDDTYSDVEW
ncbi:MAG: hypothetical protein QOK30_1305 [Nocardioidaceae bacterium]|nr:hypothetical protein [Nocardioidaceae bacterium]